MNIATMLRWGGIVAALLAVPAAVRATVIYQDNFDGTAGVLPDRVSEQTAEFAAAHPDLDVRVTDVRTPVQGAAVTNVYGPFPAPPIRLPPPPISSISRRSSPISLRRPTSGSASRRPTSWRRSPCRIRICRC